MAFKLSEQHNYMMPAHFGGYEGQPLPSHYEDVTSITINYETDPEMLAQYIPEAFELTQPAIALNYGMMRAVDWLGGGYNLILAGAPVSYGSGSERIAGLYVLVIWEDRTAPILNGREQTGMPKIQADIQDLHQVGERVFANVSYEGRTFLSLDFKRMQQLVPRALAALNQQAGTVNAFGWRYIPNVGRPGAALSHATLFPQEFVHREAWTGEGQVSWQALTREQHPNQAHIIEALSRLPIKAYGECLMTRGSAALRNDHSRQLP